MKRVICSSLVLCAGFLTGCAGGTPDCADSDALDVLHDAIVERVEKYAPQTQQGTPEEFREIAGNYEISQIRTTHHDSDIDSYQCDARITYVYRERKYSVDFEYQVDTDQSDGGVLVEYDRKMLDPILGYAIGLIR